MVGFRRITVLLIIQLLIYAESVKSDSAILPTVTVRGFLNFRTTVDNTVIVFTSAESTATAKPTIATTTTTTTSKKATQSNTVDSQIALELQELAYTQSPEKNSVGLYKLGSDLESDARSGKNSFSHISDNVVVPSPVNVISDETQHPSNRIETSQPQYPTGLVTVLRASRIDKDITTIYETKVIGTYIDGKYAQILQSTSDIIKPSSVIQSVIKSTSSVIQQKVEDTQKTLPTTQKSTSSTTQKIIESTHKTVTTTSKSTTTTFSSTNIQSSFEIPDQTIQYTSQTQSLDLIKTNEKPIKTSITVTDEDNRVQSSPQVRRTTSRYRYIHPSRETQTVRLNRFKVRLSLRQDSDETTTTESDIPEDDEVTEPNREEVTSPLPPVDPARVEYKLTTLTREVTLHVGRRKSVRTLTITTTVPRVLHSTDILQNSTEFLLNPSIDSYIPLETPPLVLSRTYSTTENTFKTSLVPVFDGLKTVMHTITESFHILKIVTAFKTLPPGNVTFLEDDELLDLPSNDSSIIPTEPVEITPTLAITSPPMETPYLTKLESSYTPIVSSSTSLPIKYANNPLLSLGAALSQNPLAAVYLGLQQLNRQVTLYSTITKTSSYVTTDTIYSTKTVRYFLGGTSRVKKITEPVSTTVRTITSTTTSLEPYLNTLAFQQQQQHLQQLIATQMPLPPQFSTITSSYTTVTTATSYSTRVYTLIYNAISTKYRTITSTSLYPTTVTLYSTKEVPISVTGPTAFPYSTQ
ncbi:mucin-2-like [Centruroides vittatus]|uniref:mucin-2-like n=1 Tax=Centruroides vittatus TaxID=120091 RepID=UPI00350F4048